MSSQSEPTRITIIWSPKARADLRSVIRETAMDILKCVDRYCVSRSGDVKKLKPPLVGFRLRCGDYRVFFDQRGHKVSRSPKFGIAATLTGEFSAPTLVPNQPRRHPPNVT